MARDRLVTGIPNKNTQRKLLETKYLKLDQAVEICRASELASEHCKIISRDTQEVDAIQQKNQFRQV